jgi:hypothetical protein
MLFGRISDDSFGTRISGRAGSDLNGMAASLLWLPVLVFATYMGWRTQQLSRGQLAIVAVIIALCPLFFWMSDRDKKEAEPLVRFISNTITPSGQTLRAGLIGSAKMVPEMRLTENGQERAGSVTAEDIYEALQNTGVGDFLILSTGPQAYLQTLLQNDGFVLERRDSDRMHHFKAVRRGAGVSERDVFTFEETLAAMIAYGSRSELPQSIDWERLVLPE